MGKLSVRFLSDFYFSLLKAMSIPLARDMLPLPEDLYNLAKNIC